MARATAKDGMKAVEAYLAKTPEPHRSTLLKVRAAIRAAAPEAEEVISYQMPAFAQDGGLVCYAAFKNHCSLFPMSGTVTKQFAKELAKYDVDKGTIRFPPDKPPPATLIGKIVRHKLAENAAKAAAKRKAS